MKNSKDILSNLYRAPLRASLVLLAVCSQAALGEEEPLSGASQQVQSEDSEKINVHIISASTDGSQLCLQTINQVNPAEINLKNVINFDKVTITEPIVQGVCNLDLSNPISAWIDSNTFSIPNNFETVVVYADDSVAAPDPLKDSEIFLDLIEIIAKSRGSADDMVNLNRTELPNWMHSFAQKFLTFLIPSAHAQVAQISKLACSLGLREGPVNSMRFQIFRQIHQRTVETVGKQSATIPLRAAWTKACQTLEFNGFNRELPSEWFRLRWWLNNVTGRARMDNINGHVRYIWARIQEGQITQIVLASAKAERRVAALIDNL